MSKEKLFNNIFTFLIFVLNQFILIKAQTQTVCIDLINKVNSASNQITESKSYSIKENNCYYVFSYIQKQSGIYDNNKQLPQIKIPNKFLNELNDNKPQTGDEIVIGISFIEKSLDSISTSNKIIDILEYKFYYFRNNERITSDTLIKK